MPLLHLEPNPDLELTEDGPAPQHYNCNTVVWWVWSIERLNNHTKLSEPFQLDVFRTTFAFPVRYSYSMTCVLYTVQYVHCIGCLRPVLSAFSSVMYIVTQWCVCECRLPDAGPVCPEQPHLHGAQGSNRVPRLLSRGLCLPIGLCALWTVNKCPWIKLV